MFSSRSKLRFTSVFLTVAVFFMAMVVSFHTHAEVKTSDHCHVCKIADQVRSSNVSTSQSFQFFLHLCFGGLIGSVSSYYDSIQLSYHSQAPPFSFS